MAAQVDFNYVDERSLNAIEHPVLIADSYWLANARISYTTADERWQASLWVNNFADEEIALTAFDFSIFMGSTITALGPPRWFGGTIAYRWDQRILTLLISENRLYAHLIDISLP